MGGEGFHPPSDFALRVEIERGVGYISIVQLFKKNYTSNFHGGFLKSSKSMSKKCSK